MTGNKQIYTEKNYISKTTYNQTMLPNTIRMRNKTNINDNQRQKNERRITSKKKSVDPKKKRERMKKKDNELNTKRNIDLGD